MEKPKVVILCGGEGTRLKEETEFKPKPMVTIGGMPILWHIMKIYSHYGFNDFVLCLGYKGEVIKQFFLSHELMHNDVTINMKNRQKDVIHKDPNEEDWNITFADTGLKTMTGGRVKRIERYIKDDNFFLTYGDGISSIDVVRQLHSKIFSLNVPEQWKATLADMIGETDFRLLSYKVLGYPAGCRGLTAPTLDRPGPFCYGR